MTNEDTELPGRSGSALERPVRALDPERADFEAWFSEGGKWPAAVRHSLSGDGYYLAAAQSAWVAWQAGSSIERERCAQLCRAMMPMEGVIRRTLLDLEREILGA